MGFQLLSKISTKESPESIRNYQNELRKCMEETSFNAQDKDKLERIENDLNVRYVLFSLSDVGLLIEKTLLNDMCGHPYHEINPNGIYQDNFPRKMLLMREYQQSRKQENEKAQSQQIDSSSAIFHSLEGG